MVDKKIIERCTNKDQGAFEELYNNTLPYVIFLCRRYLVVDKNLEDLIQDIYSEVFLSLHKYEAAIGPFKPWFRKLSIYTILKSLRKNKMQIMDIDNSVSHPRMMIYPRTTLEENDLLDLVKKLPPGYQAVFNLAIVDGFSHKEIASSLGISASTSRSQLSRAKEILKKQILNLNKIKSYGALGH